MKCFQEIISIGHLVYRIHGLPWFRSLSWYFLLTSNYFFYGENLVDYFGVVINRVVSYNTKEKKTYSFIDILIHCFVFFSGIFKIFSYLSSFPFVYTVLYWFRLVCAIISKEILHKTIQSICLDSCILVNSGYSKLPNHTKYI